MLAGDRNRKKLFFFVLVGAFVLYLYGCREAVRTTEEMGRQQKEKTKSVIQEKQGSDPVALLKARVNSILLDENQPVVLYAGTSGGVVMYDVSNPASPKEIGFVPLKGSVVSLSKFEDTIVASCGGGLVVGIDVKNKRSPSVIFEVSVAGAGLDAEFSSGDMIVVAEGSLGVGFYDVSDRGRVRRVSGWNENCYVRDVVVTETGGDRSRVFVACGRGGFAVVDVSKTGVVTGVGRLDCEADVRAVYVLSEGDRTMAFLAAGSDGVIAVRCDGESLEVVGRLKIDMVDMVRSVFVDEKTLTVFLPSGGSGLFVVDGRLPEKMEVISRFEYNSCVNRIFVSGSRAFMAADAGGIVVADVSSPSLVKILYSSKD